MPVLVKAFLVFAGLLMIQSAVSLRDGYRFLDYVRRSLSTPLLTYLPPAALIVPVKGCDEGFEANVDQLLAQDYPDYCLIFAVASGGDPAHRYLAERLARHESAAVPGPRQVKLVVAGQTSERGEKVNNLLAGLRAVTPDVEVLVFADADARPKRDWLRSLVAPLAEPAVTVSTGFRWYLPGRTFASRLRAAWDTSVATLFSERGPNFAWGGALAIRAADFRRLRVAERYWAATVSDDYAVTQAVRDAGGRIRFEPRGLTGSREESTFSEFLRWSTRQIIITRVYAPRFWWWGLAAYSLFCGTFLLGGVIMLSSRSMAARLLAVGLLAAIQVLGLVKARLRTCVAREVFTEEADALRRHGSCYWRLWPLVPWVMLINFVAAGLKRRIEWRGTRYELISASELRVLGPKD
jgi:ceramide glucosyltransferase